MEDKAGIKVLPPLVPLAAIGIGVVADRLAPARIASRDTATIIGAIVVVASLVLVAAAAWQMKRAKTAIDVRKPTTSIVSTGVYAFTRNPIYLAMVLLCVGVAFLVNTPWLLALAILAAGGLYLVAIRHEERYLDGKFGEAYRAYRAKVRRWV